MQRELDALLRAIEGDGGRRAGVQGVMHEIVFAIGAYATRMSEAEAELLGRLQRAIDEAEPQQQYRQQPHVNGQYGGPYGHG